MFFIAFITVFYCCWFLFILTQWSPIYNTILFCTNVPTFSITLIVMTVIWLPIRSSTLTTHPLTNIPLYTPINLESNWTISSAANFLSYGVPTKNTTTNVHTPYATPKKTLSPSLGPLIIQPVPMSFVRNYDSIGSKRCTHVCSLAICSCPVMILLYYIVSISMFSVVLLTVNSFPLIDHQHKRGWGSSKVCWKYCRY